jgi:hypothetical protein
MARYANCKIRFLEIGNIHAMRGSVDALRDMCLSTQLPESNWLATLQVCRRCVLCGVRRCTQRGREGERIIQIFIFHGGELGSVGESEPEHENCLHKIFSGRDDFSRFFLQIFSPRFFLTHPSHSSLVNTAGCPLSPIPSRRPDGSTTCAA